jgi:hypothetical protein
MLTGPWVSRSSGFANQATALVIPHDNGHGRIVRQLAQRHLSKKRECRLSLVWQHLANIARDLRPCLDGSFFAAVEHRAATNW